MFNRLASLAAAAPRRLAGLGLLALIVLAVFGAPAQGKLNARDAFNDPGSQSTLAQTQIQNATGHDAHPKVLALVKAPPGSAAVAHAARSSRIRSVQVTRSRAMSLRVRSMRTPAES
jgi:putative drug exporter of the RND superfamily